MACGINQPHKNLPWLSAWIKKAETDKTGNCWGTIWLVRYKDQDLFVTDMMLGSGGVLYWIMDCSGNYIDGGGGDPSAYIGNGGVFSIEDGADFESFISGLKLFENKDIPVVYSNTPRQI
jgi:hypothetical protein